MTCKYVDAVFSKFYVYINYIHVIDFTKIGICAS